MKRVAATSAYGRMPLEAAVWRRYSIVAVLVVARVTIGHGVLHGWLTSSRNEHLQVQQKSGNAEERKKTSNIRARCHKD